jgi:hypothetical protein
MKLTGIPEKLAWLQMITLLSVQPRDHILLVWNYFRTLWKHCPYFWVSLSSIA